MKTLFYESSNNWSYLLKVIGRETCLEPTFYISTDDQANLHVHDLDQPKYETTPYLGASERIYAKMYPCIYQFIDMYCRNNSPARQNVYRNWSVHQYLNTFNILIERITQILIFNKIEVVVFARIPHLGSDFLLYKIAEALDLRVLLLQQMLIPENRFFICSRIHDFGLLLRSPAIFDCDDLPEIKWKQAQSWGYMDSVRKIKIRRMETKAKLSPARRVLSDFKRILKGKNSDGVQSFREQILHLEELHYLDHISMASTDDPDLTNPFIYFAFHLQPEMTTSALGGEFVDQALALERLSKRLPAGWKILAKENPKQTAFMRDEAFFARLRNLSNVVLVGPDVSTYLLLERCELIATITGTVGWEALLNEKPVLVFGWPWYRNFPGVFEYHDNIDIEKIVSFTPNRESFLDHFRRMVSTMGRGRIYGGVQHKEIMRTERNAILVSDSLQRYMDATAGATGRSKQLL